VFYKLTDAVINRIILELRRFWSTHPKYQELVGNIQGKYSFDSRPQMGIIVKGGSASGVNLSWDNFIGTVISHIGLKHIGNNPGTSIEWIHEDAIAIQNNNGIFPSAPGLYFIDITKEDEFFVDVLQTVNGEALLISGETSFLQYGKFHPGSLTLWEYPSRFQLVEGTNYTADATTGEITFLIPPAQNTFIQADYRLPLPSTGPHKFAINQANNAAIPGVVMFFGNRVVVGDKLGILINAHRTPMSLEYGGRWSLNLDIDFFARDVHRQREIADRSLMYLWGIARSYLSTDGIEVLDASLGGESEEVYDETGDEYFFNSSLSMTVETEWSLRVPLLPAIQQILPYSLDDLARVAGLSDADLIKERGNIRLAEGFELRPFADPYFVGRNANYELIR